MTMQIWSIVAVVLLAVLVGAALPVLFQLQQTLKSSRRLMDHLDKNLRPTIQELNQAVGHLNRIGGSVEKNLDGMQELFDAVSGLGKTVNDAKSALSTAASMGATIGPVVAAVVRSLASGPEDVGQSESEHASGAEPQEA